MITLTRSLILGIIHQASVNDFNLMDDFVIEYAAEDLLPESWIADNGDDASNEMASQLQSVLPDKTYFYG